MVVFENGGFRDYGTDFLNLLGNDDGEYGNVFYTQIGGMLYTISDAADYIHVYDLNPESLSFDIIYTEPGIPITVGDGPCLASSDTPGPHLYVTGGYQNTSISFEIYKTFWILDLANNSWSPGSHMNFGRYRHGCIVVDDTLWVMGTVAQIEIIDITDLDNVEWSVHSELSIPGNLTDFGLVSTHDHSIFLIGGSIGVIGDHDSSYNSDIVYIIDTKYGNLTTETLPYAVSGLSAMRVDGTIYGFGGRNDEKLDSWITCQLLS